MNFFLSTYTVRIYKVLGIGEENNDPSKKLPLILNKFDGESLDIFDVCVRYLKILQRWSYNDKKNKAFFSVSELNIDKQNRKISGFIKTGYYGLAGDIVDVEKKSIVYEKTVNHADSMPFFFLVYLPRHRNEGIFILERIGTYGIRGVLSSIFSEYFSSRYKEFYCSINPLIPDQVVKNILSSGIIKKLRFIKFMVPTDKTDALCEGHKEEYVNAELSFSSKSFFNKDRILNIFNPGVEVKNLFELRDWGFEYDTIKIEVQYGPRSRTKVINLSDFSKVRNYVDITDEVGIDNSGHPIFEDIEFSANELCDDMSKVLYGNS